MAAELFPTIDAPSADARAQATARQNELTKPAGSLGRLEQLGRWLMFLLIMTPRGPSVCVAVAVPSTARTP